ncbi:MAG: tungsten ABC transporter substrate-binding protein [Firmicutes bacterium]|nr:tungsten ABC transporter substrate-binding protein [Bacillota bacterium]
MKLSKKILSIFLLAFLLVAVITSANVFAKERIILATTTSTDNTGLLAVLLPPFEEKFNVEVHIIAVGTGRALELGRNGDADVVLVHAREQELEFVEQGYGVNRLDVMYNDFVVLGPKSDPAGVASASSVLEAFKKIAENKSVFISRGDNSGTHVKELDIWALAGITPEGNWYRAVGQGMGASINIADQSGGYILSDRGTYLSYKDQTDLVIVFQGDELLFNPYGIMAVNPELHPHVKFDLAMELVNYFVSEEAIEIINSFLVAGEQLFFTYND